MPRELTPAEQLAAWFAEYATPATLAPPQSTIPRKKANAPTGKAALVLEAARGFNRPFTEQDLTYHAWHEWPEAFGLKGYEQEHPDRHLVRCYLFGKRGLFARGLLRKRKEDGLLEVVR